MALPDTHEGRSPVRHIVFGSIAEADNYSASLGQPFYVVDRNNMIVQHRIGDGTRGGEIIASNIMQSLPANLAKVANVSDEIKTQAEGGTTISHQLGYYPMVQALDNTQSPPEFAAVDIEHLDVNTLVLYAEPAIADALILLR